MTSAEEITNILEAYDLTGCSGTPASSLAARISSSPTSAESVDVINAPDSSLTQIIAGQEYGFDEPSSIGTANPRAWAGNWLSPDGKGFVTAPRLG